MKKILVVLMVLALAVGILASCSPAETSVSQSGEAPAKPIKIFFTNAWLTAPYCAPMTEEVTAYAAANNIDIQIADGEGDSQKQLDQIKNAVTSGVDGVIYFPADAASTIPVVKYLDESGVPFVVLNSQVDPSVQDLEDAYVGMDYEYSGSIGGQIVADYFEGRSGRIVVIEGAGGTEAQQGYQAGFEEKALANPNVEIIAKQQADWDPAKAMAIMEDYITTFGKDGFDYVYSHDDGMFAGIASAMEDAGILGTMPVVCNGQSQFVLDAIKEGNIMGSASQDPRWEGRMALQVLVQLINGEDVPKWTKTECMPITRDNVDDFQGW
jgi:ABC-type sugar transport system substrate-binding protein